MIAFFLVVAVFGFMCLTIYIFSRAIDWFYRPVKFNGVHNVTTGDRTHKIFVLGSCVFFMISSMSIHIFLPHLGLGILLGNVVLLAWMLFWFKVTIELGKMAEKVLCAGSISYLWIMWTQPIEISLLDIDDSYLSETHELMDRMGMKWTALNFRQEGVRRYWVRGRKNAAQVKLMLKR